MKSSKLSEPPHAYSLLSLFLCLWVLPSGVSADIEDTGVEHAQDDAYWAELAQDYPPFIAPLAARLAARDEHINGQWSAVIPWPHIPVTAANLPDGRILTFSSNQRDAFPAGPEYSYASTWDPISNAFSDVPHTSHDMFCGHLSMLEDGRVFVNGGRNHVKSTSTFDFRTNRWSRIADMNKGRWYPTTLALPTGSVLTAIGSSGGQYPELWTEGQGWKQLTGASLQSPILNLTANYENTWWPLLHVDPKGFVFHSGPTPNMHRINPTGLGKVTPVGPAITDWYPKHGTTVMYEEGKLLVAGGAIAGNNQASTNKAMIIDINGPSPVITPIEPMAYARKFQNGVMLPTGEVLVVGGNTSGIKFSDAGSVLAPEIWNPDTQQWRTLSSMATPRNYHSIALLLTDGRILVGGSGLCGGCAANHRNAEILSPPYLFNSDGSPAPRPSITNAPDVIKYGRPFTLQSQANISKFSLIKMSSTTHAVNTDLRFLNIPFQQAGAGLYQLTPHSNKNVLTPGYWMLFAINDEGVPSVSKVIQVSSDGLPSLTQPENQNNTVGDAVTYSVMATDPNGDTLSYQATALPDGLNINPSNGLITGSVTKAGSFNTTLTVSDGEASVSVPFTWNVYPAGSAPGISYEYYEGDWNVLPDFSTLTPVAVGTTDSFDISLRQRNEYFGFRFSTRINIETTGNYTFFTRSDDGSRLYIDGNLVVDNDGLHAMQERSGTVNLSAGEHIVIVTFFEKTGGEGLSVQYQGTGITKQLIPQSALFQHPLYNVAPVLANPGDQSTLLNQSANLNMIASDLNIEDTLSFSATNLPSGMSIHPSSGLISGTATQAGHYRSTVTVDDGRGQSNSVTFNWHIVGPVQITPMTTTPKPVNTLVSYTATVSGGDQLTYQWNFGDGTPTTSPSPNPSISHPFGSAGTPVITLIVHSEGVAPVEYQFTQAIHHPLTANQPATSMSLVYEARTGNDRTWNVNPDNHSVTVYDAVMNAKLAQVPVGQSPHALALAPDGRIWVTNKSDASISVIDPESFSVVQRITLPHASQPHGIVFAPDESYAYVALEATGQVLKLHPTSGAQIQAVNAGDKVRHLSISADSRQIYASRFITPPMPDEATANPKTTLNGVKLGGEVVQIQSTDMSIVRRITLQHSERQDAEHSARGLPNYLGPLVISPDGLSGWVPSKQDNIKRGMLRDSRPLTHDSSVRSISSRVNLNEGREDYMARVDHDNGGIASSAVYGPYGIYLYVALEGSQEVAVIHTLDQSEVARIPVGRAPQGLALSADGNTLYTHNFMDRSISVHDLSALNTQSQTQFVQRATYHTVENEQLSATILRGKQLFYDAKDQRLAREQYVSCAACHNDGMDDGRVWDMTGFGEGLRNTIDLNGRAGMQHGLLHWSGNFDEVQDFEGQIRSLSGGLGLLSDTDFHTSTRNTPLGTPKAGVNSDLDALAAYVSSLNRFEPSPHRNNDGSLTAEAIAGQQVFKNQQCASCHSGDNFTDSGPNNLHDIGTLKPSSGQRLAAALTGIDTPTLRGVWSSPPYLHDGSAADLSAAVNAHQGINLSTSEQAQLLAFLQQIDGDTDNIQLNSNPVSNTDISLDGQLSEWNSGQLFPADPNDISGSNNPINWLNAGLSHSSDTLYIAYQNRNPIDTNSSTGNSLRWGWQVMIDTDQNAATGYSQGGIGADYIIQGRHIQRYSGTGGDWQWESVANATLAYQNNTAELSLARQLIGDPSVIRVVFRGANQAYGGDQVDYYPDDERQYFEYSLPDGTDQTNTPPIANSQSLLVSANSSAAIVLQGSDADANTLSYRITQAPAQGQLSGTPPQLNYQPNPNFTGPDHFTFVVNDGLIDSAPATVHLTVSHDQGQVLYNPAGDALTLDGRDTDWGTMTGFLIDPSESSEVTDRIDWQSIVMAHDAQFVHLLYRGHHPLSDDGQAVSYLPWGWQVFLDTDQDQSTGYQVGQIGADFILEGQAIHRYIGLGSNWNWENIGVAEIQATGDSIAELRFPRSLIGQPTALRMVMRGVNAAVNGSLVDYYPDDQNDALASTQFFKYEFNQGAYHQAPIAHPQSLSSNSGSPLSIVLSGQSPQGEALSYRIITAPEHGSLTGTPPNLSYIANAGYTGQDYFTFTANNGLQESPAATVSIQVTSATNTTVSNNISQLSIDGNSNDWGSLTRFNDDPDDIPATTDTINWQNVTMAHSNDTVYLLYRNRGLINANSPAGSYIPWGWQTYLDTDNNPETGFRVGDIGADYLIEATSVLRYQGAANSWIWLSVAQVTLQYQNDIAELSLPQSAIGNPTSMRVAFMGNNQSVGGAATDYYPDNAATGDENAYFSYSLNNTLPRISQRPIANALVMEAPANKASTITLAASDADGDTLRYTVVKAPHHGTISTDNNTVTYTPNTHYTGSDVLDYVVNDGTYDSSVATVQIRVNHPDTSDDNVSSPTTTHTESSGGGALSRSLLIVLGLLGFGRWIRGRHSLDIGHRSWYL